MIRNKKEKMVIINNNVIDAAFSDFVSINEFDICVLEAISSYAHFCTNYNSAKDLVLLEEEKENFNGYIYQSEVWLDDIKSKIYRTKGKTSKVEKARDKKIIRSIFSLIENEYIFCEYNGKWVDEEMFYRIVSGEEISKGNRYILRPFVFYFAAELNYTSVPEKLINPVYDYFNDLKETKNGARSHTAAYYILFVIAAYRKIQSNPNGEWGYMNANEIEFFRRKKDNWEKKDEILSIVGMEYRFRRFENDGSISTVSAVGFVGDESFDEAMNQKQDQIATRKEKRRLEREARIRAEDEFIDSHVSSLENENVYNFSSKEQLVYDVCTGPYDKPGETDMERRKMQSMDKEERRSMLEERFGKEIFEEFAKENPAALEKVSVTGSYFQKQKVYPLSYIHLYYLK